MSNPISPSMPIPAPFESYDAAFDAGAFQQNHLDENASFSGCLYETFGPELDYILELAAREPNRVATVIDAGDNMYLAHGFHWVNCFGFHVFTKPVPFFATDLLID